MEWVAGAAAGFWSVGSILQSREETARKGGEPLHMAARKGDVDAARAALNATPDLIYSADDDGCLPLHRACEGGHLVLAKLLYQTNPTAANAVDTKHGGWTPLHYAVSGAGDTFYGGGRATVEWLLESTKVNAMAATTDAFPQTAVALAEELAANAAGENFNNLHSILELLQSHAKKRPREPEPDEDSTSKRPARAAASGAGPKFGTQEQVTAFVQSGAVLRVPETDSDVQRTQLNHNRSEFALRYNLVNKADAQPGHSTTKFSTALNRAKAFVKTRETNCRKFKIGITDNPRRKAAHGFPHSGYQVQYDRMDVIYRGTRGTAGGLKAALIESFGANGASPSDKCANDAPEDGGSKKDADAVYYTYLVSKRLVSPYSDENEKKAAAAERKWRFNRDRVATEHVVGKKKVEERAQQQKQQQLQREKEEKAAEIKRIATAKDDAGDPEALLASTAQQQAATSPKQYREALTAEGGDWLPTPVPDAHQYQLLARYPPPDDADGWGELGSGGGGAKDGGAKDDGYGVSSNLEMAKHLTVVTSKLERVPKVPVPPTTKALPRLLLASKVVSINFGAKDGHTTTWKDSAPVTVPLYHNLSGACAANVFLIYQKSAGAPLQIQNPAEAGYNLRFCDGYCTFQTTHSSNWALGTTSAAGLVLLKSSFAQSMSLGETVLQAGITKVTEEGAEILLRMATNTTEESIMSAGASAIPFLVPFATISTLKHLWTRDSWLWSAPAVEASRLNIQVQCIVFWEKNIVNYLVWSKNGSKHATFEEEKDAFVVKHTKDGTRWGSVDESETYPFQVPVPDSGALTMTAKIKHHTKQSDEPSHFTFQCHPDAVWRAPQMEFRTLPSSQANLRLSFKFGAGDVEVGELLFPKRRRRLAGNP